MESWIGFKNGEPVKAFCTKGGVDKALTRREIDSASPTVQEWMSAELRVRNLALWAALGGEVPK